MEVAEDNDSIGDNEVPVDDDVSSLIQPREVPSFSGVVAESLHNSGRNLKSRTTDNSTMTQQLNNSRQLED
jgi:hypothetical protein